VFVYYACVFACGFACVFAWLFFWRGSFCVHFCVHFSAFFFFCMHLRSFCARFAFICAGVYFRVSISACALRCLCYAFFCAFFVLFCAFFVLFVCFFCAFLLDQKSKMYTIPPTATFFFFLFSTTLFKPPQLRQYCHYRFPTGTILTALISSFERRHCHPTTATPHPTVHATVVLFLLLFFYHSFSNHHNSANTATTDFQPVPFSPH
jgi:hypothetical protein